MKHLIGLLLLLPLLANALPIGDKESSRLSGC